MLAPVEVAGAEPGDVIEVSITAPRTIGLGLELLPGRRRGAAARLRRTPNAHLRAWRVVPAPVWSDMGSATHTVSFFGNGYTFAPVAGR